MSHAHKHTIHAAHQHLAWDNSVRPAATVAPGDVVEFRDIDATSGQLSPKSTAQPCSGGWTRPWRRSAAARPRPTPGPRPCC